MHTSVLAINDLSESPPPPFLQLLWQGGGIAFGASLVLLLVLATGLSSVWLIRAIKHCRRKPQTTFQITNDPMEQIIDTRSHLEASKRHLTAVEQRIDELEEQLKRRPLS